MILHISAMRKKISVPNLSLVFSGSILSTENIFSRELRLRIKTLFPDIIIREPKNSAAYGAMMLGYTKSSITNE